ncbi:hypothetical protein B0T21DRAFT_454512 [Apiosordaria backusii]|uniref:Uncharacterized protein n=1 Tax=Apiosordaria backusii TaxID=314023 RepID=A0AA40DWF6_9PEZI|nr:hypothetical protein B0T21DRAFT_454512 [Apiosordaria backusii]
MPSASGTASHSLSPILSDTSGNESDHAGIVRSVDILSEDPFLTNPANKRYVPPHIALPSSPPACDDDDHVELPPPLHEDDHMNYRTFDTGRGLDLDADVEHHGYRRDEESHHLMDGIPENGQAVFIEREVHWEERFGVVILWIVALPLLLAALYICLDLLRKKTGSGGGGRHV